MKTTSSHWIQNRGMILFFVATLMNIASLSVVSYWTLTGAREIENSSKSIHSYTQKLEELSRISGSLTALSIPGNRIFDSKNLAKEKLDLEKAIHDFNLIVQTSRNLSENQRVMQTFVHARSLIDNAQKALDLFGRHNLKGAAQKMSIMDGSYNLAFATLDLETATVRGQARLTAQELYENADVLTKKTTLVFFANLFLCGVSAIISFFVARAIKKSERLLLFYKYAIDQSAIVAITDRRGTIEHANDNFARVSGYSREELIGENHRLLKSDHHPKEFFVDLWKTISRGNIWRAEVKNKTKSGEPYWVDTTITPLIDESGRVEKFLAIRYDITDKKQSEQNLREAKIQAENSSRAKAEFLANMSHEIRTPMNGIIGISNLILDTNLTDQQREMVSLVNTSAENLLGIINDILDFSKIEAKKIQVEGHDFSIQKVAKEAVALINFKAAQKSLFLKLNLSKDIPPLVRGDSGKFRQILMNLIGNGIKFTASGGITIDLSVTASAESSDLILQASVTDTGIGISESGISKLFDSFSQVDASTTRIFGGTGLGLSICRGLCEAMGGGISVESRLGEGSTFHFSIPVKRYTGDGKEQIGREVEVAVNSKLRILVADDSPVNQKVAEGLLKKIGLRCDLVSDGNQVLRALETKTYDVIFMDCHMPEMDGFETTKCILAGPLTVKPFIVALTASATQSDRDLCAQVGMHDFLTKPIRLPELRKVLSQIKGEPTHSSSDVGAASTSTVLAQTFDLQQMKAGLECNDDLLLNIVKLFLEDYPESLSCIDESLALRDGPRLEKSVHKLKGAISNFPNGSIAERMAQIESLARSSNFINSEPLWKEVRVDLSQFIESLRKIFSELQSKVEEIGSAA